MISEFVSRISVVSECVFLGCTKRDDEDKKKLVKGSRIERSFKRDSLSLSLSCTSCLEEQNVQNPKSPGVLNHEKTHKNLKTHQIYVDTIFLGKQVHKCLSKQHGRYCEDVPVCVYVRVK